MVSFSAKLEVLNIKVVGIKTLRYVTLTFKMSIMKHFLTYNWKRGNYQFILLFGDIFFKGKILLNTCTGV